LIFTQKCKPYKLEKSKFTFDFANNLVFEKGPFFGQSEKGKHTWGLHNLSVKMHGYNSGHKNLYSP